MGKNSKKEELSRNIPDTTALAEEIEALSLVNLDERFKMAINNADLDKANKLGLTSIKKYWRYTGQVKIKLDCLYN